MPLICANRTDNLLLYCSKERESFVNWMGNKQPEQRLGQHICCCSYASTVTKWQKKVNDIYNANDLDEVY